MLMQTDPFFIQTQSSILRPARSLMLISMFFAMTFLTGCAAKAPSMLSQTWQKADYWRLQCQAQKIGGIGIADSLYMQAKSLQQQEKEVDALWVAEKATAQYRLAYSYHALNTQQERQTKIQSLLATDAEQLGDLRDVYNEIKSLRVPQ